MNNYKVGIQIDGDAAGMQSAARVVVDSSKQIEKATVDSNRAVITSLGGAENATRTLGVAQTSLAEKHKLTAFQTTQLNYQLHDFFVQVQAGQSPLTAAIQQGSQLSGTFGGMGGVLRALGTLITPLAVGLGAVGGALGAVGLAAYQGAQQQKEFNNAMVLTGGYAGVTASQLDTMAQRVSEATRSTAVGARETLQLLVSTGRFAADALQPAAVAIEKIATLSGRSREEVVKDFEAMGRDGAVKFAENANKAYNFLNLEQYRHIKLLQEQKQDTEAMVYVAELLSKKMGSITENLGYTERAWRAVKNAASDSWSAMMGLGKAETVNDRLQNSGRMLQAAQQSMNTSDGPERAVIGRGLKQAQEEYRIAFKRNELEEGNVAAKAQQAQIAERQIKSETEWTKLKESALSKEEKKVKEIAEARRLAKDTGQSAGDLGKVEKNIADKYKDSGSGASAAAAEAKAMADQRLNLVIAQAQKETAIKHAAVDEQLRDNEQAYKMQLIGLRQYYDQRQMLQLQDIALRTAALNKELDEAKVRESKMVKGSDKLAAQAKIIGLETQLQEQSTRAQDVRISNTNARALALKQELDTIEQRLDADDAKAKKAVFDQQLASRDRTGAGKLDLIKDPQERERAVLAARMDQQSKLIEQATALNADERLSAEKQLQEELAVENMKLTEKFKPGWQKLVAEWGNTSELLKSTYNSTIDGMLSSGQQAFVRSSGDIVETGKAMVNKLKEQLLTLAYQEFFGMLFKGLGGGGGGSFGGAGSGGFGEGGNTGGGGASSGLGYIGLIASLFGFEGGGYTGNAPRSGGMDGKGGFMAILHPQESVVDHAQGQSLGGGTQVVVNVNNNAQGATATVQRSNDGRTIDVLIELVKTAVASDLASGNGNVSSAVEGRYGLRPQVG